MKQSTLPEKSESKSVIPPEQQLADLRRQLAGHKVFGRCRGRFDELPYDEWLKKETFTNPSTMLNTFDRWAADRRVILNMLAALARDGKDTALEELLKALSSNHVITGETIPLEQTEPGVLVMFDQEKTLLLARWFYTTTVKDAYNYINNKTDPERGLCGSLTPQLFQTFPELPEKFGNLPESRCECVVEELRVQYKYVWECLRQKFSSMDLSWINIDPNRTDYWRTCNRGVAIFVHGTEQDKVLKLFGGRKKQEKISTWRFDYPKVDRGRMVAYGSRPHLWLGIHPETEHAAWCIRWPSYVSRGCSGGHGAVIVDENMMGEQSSTNKSPQLPPYRVFPGVYPRECTGNLMTKRIVLGFPWDD